MDTAPPLVADVMTVSCTSALILYLSTHPWLQSPDFWVLVAALRRFIEQEGEGQLPLEVRHLTAAPAAGLLTKPRTVSPHCVARAASTTCACQQHFLCFLCAACAYGIASAVPGFQAAG